MTEAKDRFEAIVGALGTPFYSDGKRAIYRSDCLPLLTQIETGLVDLLLTDPPYGIKESAGKNKSRSCLGHSKDYGNDSWDDETADAEVALAISTAKHSIVFGGNYYDLPPSSCWLVWDKDNGDNDFADCELAWTNLKKAVRKLRWRWQGMLQENAGANKEPRFHPTQKPLAVMKWALSQAPEDCQIILDPFMGSGTTLVAAKQMNRYAIGIEKDENTDYCSVAKSRLRQSVLAFA